MYFFGWVTCSSKVQQIFHIVINLDFYKNQRIKAMKDQKCSICDVPSQETSILLSGLKKRLVQKSLKQDQEYQETKSDSKANHIETFTKVVDLITFNHKLEVSQCSHKKTYRDFYRKMRCSQLQFQQNCQQILLEIGSKCFQLDVLTQQISSFQDRVIQITKQRTPPTSNIRRWGQQDAPKELRKKKRIKKQGKNRSSSQCIQINEQENNRTISNNMAGEMNERGEKQGCNYDAGSERGLFYWPYILRNFGNE